MPANAAANRYELKELLGEGGMGVVYRALDTKTNRYVALKTLRDASDPATLEMFKREWEELGKLTHPNIVDVNDVDEIEENGVRKPCFIMPLLPGATLASLIKSSSPRLTTEFVVSMISQVCKGLQAAHEKDLIHRDLKPSNIFIMEDDTAKIIDFGLVHTVGNKSVTGLKGTWQYMAPEQIDGSKQPNRNFDIFALGVVAYEALTGHQPFRRARFEDTVEAVRHFVPQAISERNPKVPQAVSKAVHVAMAKSPMHRYATARDFAETLQKAYQNQYIERFDPVKIRPRIDRAKKAFNGGDSDFASEILTELEAEGNLDPDITLLRSQIDEFNKQKRVRQLFEAAQTRLEQDEIPLALEKLQEVLKIDPMNPEALKLRKRIEQQRSQQQVSEWLDLARKHLDRHDFSEARRALKEVFNLKYDDPEAARLKAQVDTREKEVATAQAEKEHLYSYALRHNQNGEISSALSKLEKLLELSRNVPGASVPERDKVFQAFYNDVRTERDRVDNAYAEGTRNLSEKNFEKALGICDGILYRYPQNPQFQALRLKIEHSQRQELSAYIADVGRAVETEPNLDRRVGLLDEACKRYPQEVQFCRQLSLAKELRDLVASIVNRARNYEEQGQFAEAIAQWNTLSNIHPQYPGIDFEVSQLERRREQQVEEDKKSRLVGKIDRALANASYSDAERLSQEGLQEFLQNPELLALLRLSRQGLEQNRQADRLFEDAKTQRSSGNWDRAVSLLREALDLDKRNIVVLNTLVNLLVERAHAVLDTDPAAAEPLAAEADRLDPEHPSVKTVMTLIGQAKKRRYVEQTVLQARELQNTDRNRAIDVLKLGLSVYPADPRLQNTLFSLQKEDPRPFAASVIGLVGEEKEAQTIVYPVDQTEASPFVPPPIKPPETKLSTLKPAAPKAAATPPYVQSAPPPKLPGPPSPPRGIALLNQFGGAGGLFDQNVAARLKGHSRNLIGVLVGLLASVILLGLAHWYLNRGPGPAHRAEDGGGLKPIMVPVEIHTSPGDAVVVLDGTPVTSPTPPLKKGSRHKIAISRLGYHPSDNSSIEVTGKPWEFSLTPEPIHINVSLSQTTGSVWLDDERVGALDDGTWTGTYPFKQNEEHHVLSVKGKSGDLLFKISYTMAPGKPAVVAPLETKDLLVASSLGKDAIVYAGNHPSKLALGDQESKPIPVDGLAVNLDNAPDGFRIASGNHVDAFQVSGGVAPSLSISLNGAPNPATVFITSTSKTAILLIDGETQRPKRAGYWSWALLPGSYEAKLTAPGMTDEEFPINIRKGQTFVKRVDMQPVKAPTPVATLVVSGGTPGSGVKVDSEKVGTLDAQGSLTYTGITSGMHEIEISLEGYHPFSSKQAFTAGKSLNLPNVSKLVPETGYVRLSSVKPADAAVYYRRAGEAETNRHSVSDFSKLVQLQAGSYEFSADSSKYIKQTIQVKIQNDQTANISFDLQPVVAGVETKSIFENPDDVAKQNSDWYHGKTNNYVRLKLPFQKNTLLFSKDYKQKKMSWMVQFDADNSINYTMDSKKLTIVQRVDGDKLPTRVHDADFGGSATASWIVVINMEKGAINILKQDGTLVDTAKDDKHDWSHAKIYVHGSNYFTAWAGR